VLPLIDSHGVARRQAVSSRQRFCFRRSGQEQPPGSKGKAEGCVCLPNINSPTTWTALATMTTLSLALPVSRITWRLSTGDIFQLVTMSASGTERKLISTMSTVCFSAFADLGDLLKRLPVLPVWVSASENFEGALSTQCSRSECNKLP
jgi:hypothetical protein